MEDSALARLLVDCERDVTSVNKWARAMVCLFVERLSGGVNNVVNAQRAHNM